MKEWITPVLIVGAGPAGLAAASIAARMGVQVTLLEKEALPGGLMRSAFPDSLWGIASCAGMTALQTATLSAFGQDLLAKETITGWIGDCLADEKIRLVTGSTVYAVKMKNGRIRRVDAASAKGKLEIYPERVIDATGGAGFAQLCGVNSLPGDPESGACGAPLLRLCVKGADLRAFLREGQGVSLLEDEVFSKAEARASFYGEVKITLHRKNNLPFGWTLQEESELQRHFDSDLAHGMTLIRERIAGMSNAALSYAAPGYLMPQNGYTVGCHVLEKEELETGAGDRDWAVGRILPAGEKNSCVSIPYGSFVTREVKNLILAGNSLSMSGAAAQMLCGIPFAMATGQAAGCAAVLSLIRQEKMAELDTDFLRQTLLQLGMAAPVVPENSEK